MHAQIASLYHLQTRERAREREKNGPHFDILYDRAAVSLHISTITCSAHFFQAICVNASTASAHACVRVCVCVCTCVYVVLLM